MQNTRQTSRQQQKMEELCSAALRALSGQAELCLRGNHLQRGFARMPLYAAHLQLNVEADDYRSYRGVSDGMALRMQYTDAALHQQLCPEPPIERLIFELLEQLRVESLAPAHLPGLRENLAYRFTHWSLQFYHAGLSDSALGNLLYTLAQISWARLNARQVLEETEDFLEATRAGIAPIIGHDLAGLKQQRHDQQAYAIHALSIATKLHDLIQQAREEQGEDKITDADDEEKQALRLLLNFEVEEDQGIAAAVTGNSRVFAEADSTYRIFTRQYDREASAVKLVRPALLRELREQLDKLVLRQGINSARLARQLTALFAVPARDGWRFGEEEGHIDGRRLAQLLASPAERRVFRQEHWQPRADAVASFLLDCSGSMKAHSETIAVFVDVFARALEMAGVSTEILGFTTGGWNGGRAMQAWMAQGRPLNPGRLNEVCYLVYKDADTPWRRARPAMAALLKPDLFREGIDGEAVEWACQRLRQRDARRRLLLVMSDGCPMDTATKLANDKFYLDNHLKAVVRSQLSQGGVEIYGLGVGLDLSPFYPHCQALDLSGGLHHGMFTDIFQLLA